LYLYAHLGDGHMLGHKEAKEEMEDEARGLEVDLRQLLQQLVRLGRAGQAFGDAALVETARDERLRELTQESLHQPRDHVHVLARGDGLV
jgi:hypothetical protein